MNAERPCVVHVVNSLQAGGLERLAVEMARRHPAYGYDTAICCVRAEGYLAAAARQAGVNVMALDAPPGLRRATIHALADALQSLNASLVHTHNRASLLYGVLAAHRAGIRAIIHTKHGRETPWPPPLRWRVLEPLLARRVSRFVVVSETLCRDIARALHPAPGKLRVVHNGVDTAVFAPGPASAGGGCRVGHVGRFVKEKNHAGLLRAFARVRRKFPSATLTLVGEGPLLQRCQELARALDLEAAVPFPGPRRDIPELLRQFDVFALPSLTEGISVSLLEAMASGCACVATAVGGTPEIIRDGQDGLLVPSQNDEALSGAIGRLLSDASLRTRLGQQARQTACEGFSVDKMLAGYDSLYRECLG